MLPWLPAWTEALYGPDGFYRRPEGPAGHFRTAAHAAPGELAEALAGLAAAHGCRAIVDVGAGRGELLRALAALGGGRQLHGVDVVDRPPGLPGGIGWSAGLDVLPTGILCRALVVGWELLDVVPCPVLEADDEGRLRTVLVDPAGREALGGIGAPADLAWRRDWWPGGDRLEVGRPRDELWAGLVRASAAAGGGLLLAVDYAHTASDRPPAGSLSAFRAGRAVPPRPDGSCDITAHVALDAVAVAGEAAGARTLRLGRQREELAALGCRDTELLDPGGLGGFGWLLQAVGG